jgi:hypothetical protein
MARYCVYDGKGRSVFLDGHRIFAAQHAMAEIGENWVEAPLTKGATPVFDYARQEFAIVTRSGIVEIRECESEYDIKSTLEHPDYPFRIATAREGELRNGWDKLGPFPPA